MARYKFNFRNRSLAEQINICERTVAGLAALPAEQLEQTRLPELQAKVAAARESHLRVEVLRAELKAEVSRRKQLVREARDHTIRASNMAAVNMNNEPVKMLAVGLHLIKPGAPVGVPAAPKNLRGTPTDNEGEARLRWQRTVRECAFAVEYRLDGTAVWHRADSFTQQSGTVSGLASGGKYWFRVNAVNAHGESGWSNEAPVRVK